MPIIIASQDGDRYGSPPGLLHAHAVRQPALINAAAGRIVAANGSADFLAACPFDGLSAPDAAALFRHARPDGTRLVPGSCSWSGRSPAVR